MRRRRGYVHRAGFTEREKELVGVIAQFTALHMQQAEVLRAGGFLPLEATLLEIPPVDNGFNPTTFAQVLADHFYNGDTRQGILLLAKMLVSSLYEEERQHKAP